MKIIFALATLMLSSLVFAEVSIPRADWSKEMEKGLPAALCVPSQVFMSCFNTDQEKCSNVMKVVTRECVKALNIPESFPISEATNWGTQMG